ncbi:MAG TPA: adenylate/guanylate cyclase domain-containing protein [Mycobacterium sp.]|nr:adenylate/guanylate cyclase domain-containing protein [Mycobacterium sp.]
MGSSVEEATNRCGSCGTGLRVEARFCDICGTPLSSPSATGEHKQVTVLFADVVGSMKLAAGLDAERLQEIMNELFNRSAAVVQRYQGTVDKFTGDGLMALFGAPAALEDHALRACIAALEIQSVTKELASEVLRRDGVALDIRSGLNSGDVIVGEIGSGPGRYTAVGHPVGMAQRMEAAAPAGGVLCSLSTASLVEGAARLGSVEGVAVKGTDEPVPVRQLLAIESDRMVLGRNEGLMLGRDAELNNLLDALDAADGCLARVIGAPGLGKSRLINEFTKVAADRGAHIVVGRCEAHTATLAFRALSRVLRAMFGVDRLTDAEARAHVIAQCGGFVTPTSADARILFDAMGIADADAAQLQVSVDGRRRRLVEVMMQAVMARPDRTVFILEDAHWIDEPSDGILADFAAKLTVTNSILVTTYRPEFRGALSQNAGRNIRLQPLAESAAVFLIGQLLGDHPSLAGLAERIAAAAVGNPFFIEEIVRDLAGRGVLSGSRGCYSLLDDVDEISVPGTVQAVLAARIDRLPTEAKSVLNAAAVIGSQFDLDSLRVLRREAQSDQLAELVSAELIDQTEFVPQQRFCFRHPLVRAVAYESQLSSARVQAHSRLAAAIESRDPATADENAALIASHLEAAGKLTAAYQWHMRAADWLRSRDLAAARAQWEHARLIADRLADDEGDVVAMRIAPRTMLISTTFFVGDAADSDERYREFRELTKQSGDLTSLAIGTAGRIWSYCVNDNRVPEAAVLASEIEQIIGSIDCDVQTRSIILISVAYARFATCDFDRALQVIDAIQALPHKEPIVENSVADTLRGVIEICLGDLEKGRRDLRKGTDEARVLPPVSYAAALAYWVTLLAAIGTYATSELVDEMREVLRRAESFGDIFGIIAAQWAYGTALLRSTDASRDEAIGVLEYARAGILKHGVWILALATIGPDLAFDAARKGRRDEAIEELRGSVSVQMAGGTPVFIGCACEALVELLTERGTPEDCAEAHAVVNQWRVCRPGSPALDLWWLRSRALLAKAEDDSDSHAELATQYLDLCEKLHARGRLAEARRMVDEIVLADREIG